MPSDLLRLLKDKRLWRAPGLIALVLLIPFNLWVRQWKPDFVVARGLAAQGDVPPKTPSGKPPRHDASSGAALDRYLPLVPDARTSRLIVLSGMSQLHFINDRKEGDQLTCEWMDDALAPGGARVWGISAPNLCNEEALFQLLTFLSDPATRPSVWIYGICFDKFRNLDLRPGYQRLLRSRPDLRNAWESLARRIDKTYPAASAKMLSTLKEIDGTQVQEDSFEGRLRAQAGQYVPLVAARKDLNTGADLMLYKLRNALLGISNTTKRPMVPIRYDQNREFLQALLDLAAENHVQVLFYIIPLNPVSDNPYIPEQYAQFKSWIEQLCRTRNIPLVNLENTVPAEHWGLLHGQPDFKHFRGEAHRITANALIEAFRDHLTPSTTGGNAP